ncbi:MAG: hypothetical protein R8G34_00950 [Paracoccaceae bacterium]|nr:hypothetical protein [Paracoccaceae bacterium]
MYEAEPGKLAVRGFGLSAALNAVSAHVAHHPFNGAAGHTKACPFHRIPQFARPSDRQFLFPNPL